MHGNGAYGTPKRGGIARSKLLGQAAPAPWPEAPAGLSRTWQQQTVSRRRTPRLPSREEAPAPQVGTEK